MTASLPYCCVGASQNSPALNPAFAMAVRIVRCCRTGAGGLPVGRDLSSSCQNHQTGARCHKHFCAACVLHGCVRAPLVPGCLCRVGPAMGRIQLQRLREGVLFSAYRMGTRQHAMGGCWACEHVEARTLIRARPTRTWRRCSHTSHGSRQDMCYDLKARFRACWWRFCCCVVDGMGCMCGAVALLGFDAWLLPRLL